MTSFIVFFSVHKSILGILFFNYLLNFFKQKHFMPLDLEQLVLEIHICLSRSNYGSSHNSIDHFTVVEFKFYTAYQFLFYFPFLYFFFLSFTLPLFSAKLHLAHKNNDQAIFVSFPCPIFCQIKVAVFVRKWLKYF